MLFHYVSLKENKSSQLVFIYFVFMFLLKIRLFSNTLMWLKVKGLVEQRFTALRNKITHNLEKNDGLNSNVDNHTRKERNRSTMQRQWT